MDKEGLNVFEKWGIWPGRVGQEVYEPLYQPMCSAAVMKCWNSGGFCFLRAGACRLLNFCVGGTGWWWWWWCVPAWLVVGGADPVFLGSPANLDEPLLASTTCTRLFLFLWWQAFISSLLTVQLLIGHELSKSPLDTQEQWTRLTSNNALILGLTGQVAGGNLSTRVVAPLVFIGDKIKHIRHQLTIIQAPDIIVHQL